MSSFALLMLLAAGALAFVFVKTLQKDGMKIASDPEHENNIARAEQMQLDDAFEQSIARADRAYEEGSLHDAEAALETALRMQPENEEVLGRLAFVLEKQGDFVAAEGIYSKALETHKNSYRLWAGHARLMEGQDEMDKAKESYIQAVQLEPQDPTVYFDFANLLIKLDEKDAAKQGFERALEVDKNFSPAKEALASL